jgi:hypothetical protein
MKKLIVSMLFLPLGLHAQQPFTIRDVLLTMPDSLAPYLSHDNRLDLFDYVDAKMTPEVTNELQGRTRLVSMGTDSLVLKMNDSHELMVYLFETEEEVDSAHQVIALSHSYKLSTGQQDCTLRFFSHRWQAISQPTMLSSSQRARLREAKSTLLRRDEEVLSREPITQR